MTDILTRIANPQRFTRVADRLLPWLAALTIVTILIGQYGAWFVAPPDYQQGETIRIKYVHVPAAWMALFGWSMMALSAIGSLVFRHPLADVAQKAAAPIGAAFCAICLITGSLWGKPMWGTWWVWDARLTSMLVLMLMYLGVIALWRAIEEPTIAAKAVSIVTLVCAINIPIIKFSVDWWNTLHQPASVLRLDGPTIHSSQLWPLLVMGLAAALLFATLLLLRMRTELMERRLRRQMLNAARG
ncbi:MAG: heme ABC transporter permease [Beijerinckiaceae bacterium]